MENFILETPRLKLREITPADAPELYALNLDPEVIQYTGDPPFESVEATETFFRNYPDYRRNGYGRWLMVRKEDGAVLGWCGLKYLPETQETDIGYRLFKKYWGAGYATEAAKACLQYGFETLKLDTIIARAMQKNVASVNIMKKLGMTFWKEALCDQQPGVYYKITRPELDEKFKDLAIGAD